MSHPEPLGPDRLLHGRLEHLDGTVRYFISGDLDVGGADALRQRVLALAAQSSGDVILDLGELEFVDSTGIGALIVAQRVLAGAGRRLVLRNPQGAVQRVLERTGLAGLLLAE